MKPIWPTNQSVKRKKGRVSIAVEGLIELLITRIYEAFFRKALLYFLQIFCTKLE